MRELLLDFVIAVGLLCGLVLAVDAAPRALASLRRRRAARGGAFGVVVDRAGRVLGTYLDPFAHPWRTPREHGPESPWVASAPDGLAMAWEGFGATREEALHAANRLRRRQLQLLSWLEDDEHGEDDWVKLSEPMAPPG
jgi:hypothetical protein